LNCTKYFTVIYSCSNHEGAAGTAVTLAEASAEKTKVTAGITTLAAETAAAAVVAAAAAVLVAAATAVAADVICSGLLPHHIIRSLRRCHVSIVHSLKGGWLSTSYVLHRKYHHHGHLWLAMLSISMQHRLDDLSLSAWQKWILPTPRI
jgi:hypothetical protein